MPRPRLRRRSASPPAEAPAADPTAPSVPPAEGPASTFTMPWAPPGATDGDAANQRRLWVARCTSATGAAEILVQLGGYDGIGPLLFTAGGTRYEHGRHGRKWLGSRAEEAALMPRSLERLDAVNTTAVAVRALQHLMHATSVCTRRRPPPATGRACRVTLWRCSACAATATVVAANGGIY